MKSLLILLCALVSYSALALEVKIEINPKQPLVGENFSLDFILSSKKGSDPDISFNPVGVEVLSRDVVGESTKTVYMNGKLSVERNITVRYEMLASRFGTAYLKDIKISLDGKESVFKNYKIKVLKEAAKNRDVMAVAIVDKDDVFAGESILVRYYLYHKIQVTSHVIKKFPDFKDALKRYHQENVRGERVQYNGDIYNRSLMYTAQIFPNKAGVYKVKPMSFEVNYVTSNSRGHGFGFGFRQVQKRTIRSKTVDVKVRKLPVDNVPKSFTGLVGDHSFEIKMNKNKFLANEPIELTLTVKGRGALELFDAPALITHENIEEFDSSSELKISPDFSAIKTFNYTYLGRGDVNIEDLKIPFSYFSSSDQKYKTVNLSIGNLIVVGGQVANTTQDKKKKKIVKKINTQRTSSSENIEDYAFEPIVKVVNSYIYSAKKILFVLMGICLIFGAYKLFPFVKTLINKEDDFIKHISKKGVDYSDLYQLISMLGVGQSMEDIITKSELSKSAKVYFIKFIEGCETSFKENGEIKRYKVEKKYLYEIEDLIKSLNVTM